MAVNQAQKFKPNQNNLTEFRVKLVMRYLLYCYSRMVDDKKTYNYSKKGKLKQEDFLRNGLVDDYLMQKENKNYYKTQISDNPNSEIWFSKEENQVYDASGELSDDYIDISIKENKLSEILSNETNDEIKFAVECKRISNKGDCKEYIGDIQKFADRSYTTFRLPYEGQIGFIEDDKLTHVLVSKELNAVLKVSKTIKTSKFLASMSLDDSLDCSYSSTHERNHKLNTSFSIFHVLLDYSGIVVKS
jgi:hypothetical protein